MPDPRLTNRSSMTVLHFVEVETSGIMVLCNLSLLRSQKTALRTHSNIICAHSGISYITINRGLLARARRPHRQYNQLIATLIILLNQGAVFLTGYFPVPYK